MAGGIQVFNFADQNQIRVIERDGNPWFVAKDVCDVLGLTNARKAVKTLEDYEKADVTISYGSQNRHVNTISESGLYRLIFKSNKPAAKEFTRWVACEVIPSIRKHGMYMTDKVAEMAQVDPKAFETVTKKYLEAREKNQQLQKYIEDNQAYTTLGRAVMAIQGSIPVKDAADLMAQKGVKIGQNLLYKWLRNEGYACNRKGRQWNKPVHKAIEQGLLALQVSPSGFAVVTMITPKGLKKFTGIFLQEQLPIEYMLSELEQDEDSEIS